MIGLQSTGEARAQGAAKAAGINADEGGDLDAFVSAPNEDLKRIIMQLFPLPPKPAGVIAPEFLNPLKKDELLESSDTAEEENSSGRQPLRRARSNVNYSERDVDNEGNVTGSKHPRSRPRDRKNTKKRRSSSTFESDDESASLGSEDSDDTYDLGLGDSDSSDDEEGAHAKEEKSKFDKEKKSRRIPWNEIDMHADESTMSPERRIDYQRMKKYREACEMVQKWLQSVDKLELPANPLDRLLNELGGPDKGKTYLYFYYYMTLLIIDFYLIFLTPSLKHSCGVDWQKDSPSSDLRRSRRQNEGRL